MKCWLFPPFRHNYVITNDTLLYITKTANSSICAGTHEFFYSSLTPYPPSTLHPHPFSTNPFRPNYYVYLLFQITIHTSNAHTHVYMKNCGEQQTSYLVQAIKYTKLIIITFGHRSHDRSIGLMTAHSLLQTDRYGRLQAPWRSWPFKRVKQQRKEG